MTGGMFLLNEQDAATQSCHGVSSIFTDLHFGNAITENLPYLHFVLVAHAIFAFERTLQVIIVYVSYIC